jgi:hypothetical protein
MIRFDFPGTTRGGYARGLIDNKLKEEFKCFRCTLIERCVIETIQQHTDDNRRCLSDFADLFILLHNLFDAGLRKYGRFLKEQKTERRALSLTNDATMIEENAQQGTLSFCFYFSCLQTVVSDF